MVALGGTVIAVRAASDPLADLKAGADALDAGRYPAAIAALKGLPQRLPKLADYAAWFLASAQSASKDYASVPATLDPVFKQSPASPLIPRSALLAADALTQNNDPNAALDLLRKYYSVISQPKGDLAMAAAFAGSGDNVSAAIYYQRVYYGYPLSAEAGLASTEIDKLQTALGEKYPPALPPAMLGRAIKLLDAGQAVRGRKELEALVPQLGGAERDLARVRIGVARYTAEENAVAYKYLSTLDVDSPEADAERLYYVMQSGRRLNNLDEMDAVVAKLGRLYPNSPWRLQALIGGSESLPHRKQGRSIRAAVPRLLRIVPAGQTSGQLPLESRLGALSAARAGRRGAAAGASALVPGVGERLRRALFPGPAGRSVARPFRRPHLLR